MASEVVSGMVFKRSVESNVTKVEKCKIAVYTCPIDSTQVNFSEFVQNGLNWFKMVKICPIFYNPVQIGRNLSVESNVTKLQNSSPKIAVV